MALSPAVADPRHVAAVIALVDTATRRGDPLVVAIDGPSGSGKTTLAKGVERALAGTGRTGAVVSMDRVYPGWDGLAAAPGLLARQVLAPLRAGRAARYRLWDWTRDAWDGWAEVPRCEVLVVEGCGSSAGPARPYVDVRVWLEAERDLRRRRGLDRDGLAYAPYWERWAAQEDALFAQERTRERADLVIDTGPTGLRAGPA